MPRPDTTRSPVWARRSRICSCPIWLHIAAILRRPAAIRSSARAPASTAGLRMTSRHARAAAALPRDRANDAYHELRDARLGDDNQHRDGRSGIPASSSSERSRDHRAGCQCRPSKPTEVVNTQVNVSQSTNDPRSVSTSLVKQAVAASVDHLLANDLLGALDFSSVHDGHGTDGHGGSGNSVTVKLDKARSKSEAPAVTQTARSAGGGSAGVTTRCRVRSRT